MLFDNYWQNKIFSHVIVSILFQKWRSNDWEVKLLSGSCNWSSLADKQGPKVMCSVCSNPIGSRNLGPKKTELQLNLQPGAALCWCLVQWKNTRWRRKDIVATISVRRALVCASRKRFKKCVQTTVNMTALKMNNWGIDKKLFSSAFLLISFFVNSIFYPWLLWWCHVCKNNLVAQMF